MDELSTMLSLLRNISSAARLLENYVVKESTYNPGPGGVDKFENALKRIKTILNNSQEIAELNIKLQKALS